MFGPVALPALVEDVGGLNAHFGDSQNGGGFPPAGTHAVSNPPKRLAPLLGHEQSRCLLST